jgi:hypothetical protein
MATEPNLEPTIQRITERYDSLPGGGSVKKTVVQYMLGTHGPFTYVVESDKFNPATVKAEIAKQQAAYRALYS